MQTPPDSGAWSQGKTMTKTVRLVSVRRLAMPDKAWPAGAFGVVLLPWHNATADLFT
jgi:hypothetical protein